MDIHATAAPAVVQATTWPVEMLQGLSLQHLIPLLAVIVWFIEHQRRAHSSTGSDMGQRLFRQLLPEMAGLTLLSGLVAMLLVCKREDHVLQGDA